MKQNLVKNQEFSTLLQVFAYILMLKARPPVNNDSFKTHSISGEKGSVRHFSVTSNCNYSQTWATNHFRIATTCLQRPPIFRSHVKLSLHKWPLNNNHLSTTATIFGFQGWLLYSSLTVSENELWLCLTKMNGTY